MVHVSVSLTLNTFTNLSVPPFTLHRTPGSHGSFSETPSVSARNSKGVRPRLEKLVYIYAPALWALVRHSNSILTLPKPDYSNITLKIRVVI